MQRYTRYLRSDNGPEFVSKAVLKWLMNAGIETAHIDPGKPWQNGSNESFNGKFRDECLSLEWFRSRREAKVIIERWRKEYNHVRPHSSLDYRTPREFRLLFEEPRTKPLAAPGIPGVTALHHRQVETPRVEGLETPLRTSVGAVRAPVSTAHATQAFGKEATSNTEG